MSLWQALNVVSNGSLKKTTANLPDYNSDYTVDFWFRLDDDVECDLFIIYGTSSTDRDMCRVDDSAGSKYFVAHGRNTGTQYTDTGSTALTVGQWYFVSWVRSGDTCKIYLDGVEEASVSPPVSGRTAATTFYFLSGSFTDTRDFSAAGLKVWEAAHDAGQRTAEALAITPATYTSIWGFFPFSASAYEEDLSGNGYDLTISNSAQITELGANVGLDVPYWRGFGTAPDLGPFQAPGTATGTAAFTIPMPTQAASGTSTAAGATGTAAFTIPIPTQAATGTATTAVTGTSAFTIPMPTQAASGTVTGVAVTGTAAFTAPMPTQAASGTAVTAITGTAAFTAPMPTQAASGTAEHTGTAAFTIPMPTMASSGTATTAVTGTAAFTAPMPTQAASGTSEHTGTAAFTIPLPTQAATGTATGEVTGTAAFTIPMPTQAAEGTIPVTGTAAFTIPLPTMASTGTSIGSVDTVSHRVVLEKDFTGLTISSSYTLTLPMGHTPVDATSGAVTITLPAAASGIRHTVKKIDSSANAVTIDGAGSETIDGSLTAVITAQYDSITVWSDQTEWWIE